MSCISRNCLLLVVLTCLFRSLYLQRFLPDIMMMLLEKAVRICKSLSTILNDATDVGYNGLWNLYKTTDRRSDGKVGHVFRCNELYFWNRSMWHIWG